jgi:hypothetical protein
VRFAVPGKILAHYKVEFATDLPNSLLRALRRCLQDRHGSGLIEGHAELPEKSIRA